MTSAVPVAVDMSSDRIEVLLQQQQRHLASSHLSALFARDDHEQLHDDTSSNSSDSDKDQQQTDDCSATVASDASASVVSAVSDATTTAATTAITHGTATAAATTANAQHEAAAKKENNCEAMQQSQDRLQQTPTSQHHMASPLAVIEACASLVTDFGAILERRHAVRHNNSTSTHPSTSTSTINNGISRPSASTKRARSATSVADTVASAPNSTDATVSSAASPHVSRILLWRTQMIRWCFHIAATFHWNADWVHQTFELVDRYTADIVSNSCDNSNDNSNDDDDDRNDSQPPISYRSYQRCCMVCLHIISKMHHCSLHGDNDASHADNDRPRMLTFDIIEAMSNGQYTQTELRQTEYALLTLFQWRIVVPTVAMFYSEMMTATMPPPQQQQQQQSDSAVAPHRITDQLLCDPLFRSHPNSLVALAMILRVRCAGRLPQSPAEVRSAVTQLFVGIDGHDVLVNTLLPHRRRQQYQAEWEVIDVMRAIDDMF